MCIRFARFVISTVVVAVMVMVGIGITYFNRQSLPTDEQVLSGTYVTYGLDAGCTQPNNTAFLQNYIDFTPYRQGCGSWGDRIVPYDTDASGSFHQRDAGVLFGLIILPVIVVGLSIATLTAVWQCYHSNSVRQTALRGWLNECRWLWCSTILLLHALILATTTTVIVAPGGLPDTWICRPYVGSVNAFGDLYDLSIVSEDEWRGSGILSKQPEWDQLLAIVKSKDCPGIVLQPSPPDRSFQLRFQPGPDTAALLHSIKLQLAVITYGYLAFTIVIFGIVLLGAGVCPCACEWRCPCLCQWRAENAPNAPLLNNAPVMNKEVIVNEQSKLVVSVYDASAPALPPQKS